MKKVDPQLLLSIGVLVVSFAALFVSIRQATLLNRQTEILLQQMKSSAWPSMSVDMHFGITNDSAISELRILVGNKGLGPAVVEGVKVMVDGESAASWNDVGSQLDPEYELNALHGSYSSLYRQVLSPAEEITFLDMTGSQPLMQLLYLNGHRISM